MQEERVKKVVKPEPKKRKVVERDTISRERVRQIQSKAFVHAKKRLMEMGIFGMNDIL